MALSDGDVFVSGDIVSFQQMERMKDNWRAAAAVGNPQSGMLFSDSGDDELYHRRTAAWGQLIQSDETGVVIYNQSGSLYQWTYQGSVADDGTFNLPAITTAAMCLITCGSAEYALFYIDDDGDVTLIANSANVVANADTDTNLCIGTAATQEPLTVRNRLGGALDVNLIMWYD